MIKKQKISIFLKLFVAAITTLLIFGCASKSEIPPEEEIPQNIEEVEKQVEVVPEPLDIATANNPDDVAKPPESPAIEQGPYRLRVGDRLEISVRGMQDMSKEVAVIPDGTISYLLIGSIKALGRTVSEIQEEITRKLKKLSKSKSVEMSENEPYRLHVGDILEISLLDEPEMTKDVAVIPGGHISYLLVGDMPALGKTIEELRIELEKKLEKYFVSPKVSILTRKIHDRVIQKDVFTNPEVSVIIKEVQSEFEAIVNVAIIGAVQNPGKFEFQKGARVIDVIAKAGGFLFITDAYLGGKMIANFNASYISRRGEKLDVNFDHLIRLGRMNNNILMENGDFIYIADSDVDKLFILGEVNNPQPIPYDIENLTLAEAVARGGGFTLRAQRSAVIVLRKTPEGMKSLEIDMEAMLMGDEAEKNILLKAGDIVFVPEQGLSKYSRYAQYLMTLADLLLKGYEVRQAVRFPQLKRLD